MDFQEINALKYLVNGKPMNVSNLIRIDDVSQLPAPVGNVITLSQNDVTYQFIGIIDLVADSIVVTGTNVKFLGLNPSIDGIVSTTAGDLITSNNGFNISDLVVAGLSAATLIKCTGTGVEFFTSDKCTYVGGTTQVDVSNFDTGVVNFGFHSICVNAIKFQSTFKSAVVLTCLFRDITGIAIDLGTAVFGAVGIDLCTCINTATTTFLSMGVDSSNLTPDGEGTITNCKIDTTLGGVGSVGYSPLDLLWHSTGNKNILTSDRVLPNGWQFSTDGLVAVPTQDISITPVKLLIDGDGVTSNSQYLPNAIQATGVLWDVANSCIDPMVIGDSYDMRVSVTISALSGNPLTLTLTLDIGGAAGITIPVAEDTKAVKGVTEPIIFSFPLFALATFVANKGQVFLNSDTGTITINARTILLVRTSSGES